MVHVVAQLPNHDRERHQRYTAGFRAVLQQYGVRLLAENTRDTTRGGVNGKALEGGWERDQVILLSFADRSAYEA
jgi:uncharacterized protein (DUF1330 family)